MRALPVFLILGSCFLLSWMAKADFILHDWEDHHETKSQYDLNLREIYYNSSANYDGAGTSVGAGGLSLYTRLQTDLLLSYGLLDRLTIYGRMSWSYISLIGSVRPGAGYSFADQTLGVSFRIFEDHKKTQPHFAPPLFIDLQAQIDFPGYSTATSESNLTPYPGDGTVDTTAGFALGTPIFSNQSEALTANIAAGYTYRNANFSAAIPWTASIQYSPYQSGLTAGLTTVGLTSLKTDPNAAGPVRSSYGAGGSFIIGGTNSSLISVKANLGYKFEPNIETYLNASQSIWGQVAPLGFTVTAGFQTRWGGSKRNPVYLTPESYGHSNKGFLNYSMDAKVLKSNDRLNLVKIDKGIQDGVEVGQLFDVFVVKKDGSQGEAIARGQVSSVKMEEAALEINEYFKEVWIEEGYIARRVIQ